MKKLLLIVVALISITCAMQSWQFYFPPRLMIYNLLCMLFVVLFAFYYFAFRKKFFLKKELKIFIILQCLYLIIIIFSGVKLILPSVAEESFEQYFKIVIHETFNVIFFAVLILYLSQIKSSDRKLVLNCYVIGVICSCIYTILYLSLYVKMGINIGYIWDTISYGEIIDDKIDMEPTWAVMGVPRGIGFAGVNAAAMHVVTALPLLTISALVNKSVKNISFLTIAIMGLLATISRTGVLSFGVAFLVLIVLERRRLRGFIGVMFLGLISIVYLAYMNQEFFSEIFEYRIHIDYSRLKIYRAAIELFYQNPILGIGANNFSVARFSLPSTFYHDANVHNSWLSILVELGIVGLLTKSIFFAYIIFTMQKRKNFLASSFKAALIGLFVGAMYNQLFELFYFNFFIAIFFISIVLDNSDPYKFIRSVPTIPR